MESNLTSNLLRYGRSIPIINTVSFLGLKVQEYFWSKNPELTIRVSNFLPIGGFCSLAQILILSGLKFGGMSTIAATVIAVIIGTFINYVLNRKVTWQDRFQGLSRRQQRVWFIPLYGVFLLSTFANYLKIGGVPYLEGFGVPAMVALIVFEIVGTILNFIGNHTITFGLMTWVIKRLSRS